jgi:type II secretory pathway component PulF
VQRWQRCLEPSNLEYRTKATERRLIAMTEPLVKTLSLDDLIAFNDELAALARAGVPLRDALGEAGGELPKNLARISSAIGARMEKGTSLADALAAEGKTIPPVYVAMVTAGIRSGRLPAALEQLGTAARRMAVLRRIVASALVYPAIVLLLAYGLFLFFVVRIAPVLALRAPLAVTNHPPALLQTILDLRESVPLWGPIPPAIFIALLFLWWLQSRRAGILQSSTALPLLGPFAPLRLLFRDAQAAEFSETLALLVEHETPLPEAVVLAAETTGDRSLIAAAHRLADEIRAGRQQGTSTSALSDTNAPVHGTPPARLPPMLDWLIRSGAGQKNLAAVLRQNAETYRRRAIARADWLRWRLPVFLTVAVGGTATLLYGLVLFIPWISILNDLQHLKP